MPYQSNIAPLSNPNLPPTLAIVIYGNVAALKHGVQQTAQGYAAGPGVPLSDQDIHAVFQHLGNQDINYPLPNTLACSSWLLAWWIPPGKRGLRFNARYTQTASISELSDQPIPHPGLVMIARQGRLSVYAVKGKQRPGRDTELCHAPYWNIFDTGDMCQGTVRYPESLLPQSQPEWEAAFFQSTFTGPSRTDRYINWGGSHEELLRSAINAKRFPEKVLIGTGQTLQQVLVP